MRGLIQNPVIIRQGFVSSGGGTMTNGFFPQNLDFNAMNRNGGTLVVGDVMMMDMALSSEAANFTFGDSLSAWYNLVTPTAAGALGGYPLALALDTPADNAVGLFRAFGIGAANMDSAPAVGADLCSDYGGADANALSATFAAGDRVCAIATTAADPSDVWFFGFGSLGTPTVS